MLENGPVRAAVFDRAKTLLGHGARVTIDGVAGVEHVVDDIEGAPARGERP